MANLQVTLKCVIQESLENKNHGKHIPAGGRVTMIKTLYAICYAASIATCHADIKLGILSESDGQRMVLTEFANCAFEKGAFDNDESLLLLFCWIIPNKGMYAFFSAARQKYSDGILWEMMRVAEGKLFHCEETLGEELKNSEELGGVIGLFVRLRNYGVTGGVLRQGALDSLGKVT